MCTMVVVATTRKVSSVTATASLLRMPKRMLGVKPHEVVRTQDPRDGGPTLQTAVRAMPVVVMEPLGELSAPLVGVSIEAGVGPLEQGGFDEALDLAIGARGVGPREEMLEAEPVAAPGEAARPVARAVIGHHRGDPDAEAAQRLHGAL